MRALGLAAAAGITAIAVLTGLAVEYTRGQTRTSQPPIFARELRLVSSFAGIADPRARSIALFEEAGKVLQHPRCVNCHPVGDRPLQTDRMQPHQPLVVRGKDGHGVPGMACATCHHAANFDPARVPGDPHWHLAPASAGWQGKSLGFICEQIKDPARNGKRDIAAILNHMTTDSLIKWSWAPGAGRTSAPGTHSEFVALLRAWAETGAPCPLP
ncbi:MAG: Isoquinoline 1-oxidoreductase subunit [Hyphomicrobiaceae bacterium]